jgi:hypothetical protein
MQDELADMATFVGGGEAGFEAEFVGCTGFAPAGAFDLCGVIAAARRGSRFRVVSSMSTNTETAPA